MIFVDTGGWYAIVVPTDARHAGAIAWYQQNTDSLLTTDYIVDETLTLLRARGEHIHATGFGEDIFAGRLGELYFLSIGDVLQTWETYRRYADKDWSFTDCSSKVVIEKLGITHAFAFDQHFHQFGTVTVVPKSLVAPDAIRMAGTFLGGASSEERAGRSSDARPVLSPMLRGGLTSRPRRRCGRRDDALGGALVGLGARRVCRKDCLDFGRILSAGVRDYERIALVDVAAEAVRDLLWHTDLEQRARQPAERAARDRDGRPGCERGRDGTKDRPRRNDDTERREKQPHQSTDHAAVERAAHEPLFRDMTRIRIHQRDVAVAKARRAQFGHGRLGVLRFGVCRRHKD